MNNITNPIKNILCTSWQGRLDGSETILQTLKLFVNEVQAQEYCFTKNYPSLEKLESVRDEAVLFNVLINQVKTVANQNKVFVFGDSMIEVITTGYKVCKVIATHTAIIKIKALGKSIVNIELYKGAECIVEKSESAIVNVIKK